MEQVLYKGIAVSVPSPFGGGTHPANVESSIVNIYWFSFVSTLDNRTKAAVSLGILLFQILSEVALSSGVPVLTGKFYETCGIIFQFKLLGNFTAAIAAEVLNKPAIKRYLNIGFIEQIPLFD